MSETAQDGDGEFAQRPKWSPDYESMRQKHAKDSTNGLKANIRTGSPLFGSMECSAMQSLVDEREAQQRQKEQTAEEKRHTETSTRLDALKHPHWTQHPSFWVGVVTMIFAAITACPPVLDKSSAIEWRASILASRGAL